LIEIPARVGRHRLGPRRPALRAGDRRLPDHAGSRVLSLVEAE